ncbi:MAG: hypothetical protein H0Z33_14355 [Bacillaceae bacterium]|nr:hypothetical protein [Bacillaceae bacterium]
MKPFILILSLLVLVTGCGTGDLNGTETGQPDVIDIRGTITELSIADPPDTQVEEDTSDQEANPDDPVSSDDPDTDKVKPDREILGSMLVEGEAADNNMYDKAMVRVTPQTRLFAKKGDELVPISIEDLTVGDLVEVTFTGPVAESYPVQATAGKIILPGEGE